MPMTSPPTPVATRVVVIDDSEDLRVLLRAALERRGGFEVVAEAEDGAQGVAAVVASQPDVVLLDIAMPVMDGLQALAQIRVKCPTVIVVMLSAFGDTSGVPERALAAGANGYIHKGGRIQAVPEQLRVIIGGVTAERAARRARTPTQPSSPGAPV
jgi:DNA-binding NarL/FixJ family response regulator